MTNSISELLQADGAELIRFVDISQLPPNQTQGFSKAIFFCLPVSREFILAKYNGEDTEHDDFLDKEHKACIMSDRLAEYLEQKGYRAYSQSDENNYQNGNFDEETQSSKLPHKTIARLAGIGFIGKNNLLITEEYGCAFCMGTILTNAPVTTENFLPIASQCGDCNVCKETCPANAILGNEWSERGSRESTIDVLKCCCELKCMVFCPYTLKYAKIA